MQNVILMFSGMKYTKVCIGILNGECTLGIFESEKNKVCQKQ